MKLNTVILGNFYALYEPIYNDPGMTIQASFFEFSGIEMAPDLDQFQTARRFPEMSTLEFFLDKLATGRLNEPGIRETIENNSKEVSRCREDVLVA